MIYSAAKTSLIAPFNRTVKIIILPVTRERQTGWSSCSPSASHWPLSDHIQAAGEIRKWNLPHTHTCTGTLYDWKPYVTSLCKQWFMYNWNPSMMLFFMHSRTNNSISCIIFVSNAFMHLCHMFDLRPDIVVSSVWPAAPSASLKAESWFGINSGIAQLIGCGGLRCAANIQWTIHF